MATESQGQAMNVASTAIGAINPIAGLAVKGITSFLGYKDQKEQMRKYRKQILDQYHTQKYNINYQWNKKYSQYTAQYLQGAQGVEGGTLYNTLEDYTEKKQDEDELLFDNLWASFKELDNKLSDYKSAAITDFATSAISVGTKFLDLGGADNIVSGISNSDITKGVTSAINIGKEN